MPKTKISEFDVDPANNTDINSINIAEGCAPSGINNAIRQLMSDLKEFQIGGAGDPFNGAVNGTVGATTPNTGAFTTLSASGAFSANGGATLGDASGDALTINSSAVSIPNGLNFDSNTFVIDATNNRVGVGTASPTVALDVTGALKTSLDASISGLTVGKGAGAVATNTAVGASALAANTSGATNTAVGQLSLLSNQGGSNNTAIGRASMAINTSGSLNAALGEISLYSNTSGSYNTGLGYGALFSNTTASQNTAVGYQAGYSNTTAINNTFLGYLAGYTSTGANNTCIGSVAGYSLTTGVGNTFIGAYVTALGTSAGSVITTGSKNTIIGGYSGNQGGLDIRTASNYIVLSDGDGNPRAYWDNSGYLYSIGVYNGTTGSAANVHVTSGGALFRSTSSLKYKRDVQNATHGLNEVMQLRPVTYKGKSENDGETVFGGLIAEEVDAIGLTEFVQYAEDGSPDALAYGNMVSLCVKAIQELKAEVDSLKAQLNNGV